MKLSDYKNITKFLEETKEHNLRFSIGECGICRPCLGIMQGTSWVSYRLYDEDYETTADCSGAWGPNRPDSAYHKHDCFAVLMHPEDYQIGPSDADKEKALRELDAWLGDVLQSGFKVIDYEQSDLFSVLLGSNKKNILKAVVNK